MADCWYAGGLRFECQGSGRCCRARQEETFVYLTLDDRRRLAAHLGLATAAFTRKYCQRTDGLLHLRYPDRDCEFLRPDGCAVYPARPSQCRTWPFWPENMGRRTWQQEVATFCLGVGKGRHYTAEEIDKILEEQ